MADKVNLKKFSKIIKIIARKYNGPVFLPHITLVGAVVGNKKDFVSKTDQISQLQGSFAVQLGTVDSENFRYKALFINVIKNEILSKLYE